MIEKIRTGYLEAEHIQQIEAALAANKIEITLANHSTEASAKRLVWLGNGYRIERYKAGQVLEQQHANELLEAKTAYNVMRPR